MRIGFDTKTINDMYVSLAAEAFDFHDFHGELPPLRHVPLNSFGPNFEYGPPQTAIACVTFPDWEAAEAMWVNKHMSDFIYEDEMICILIHEICHIIFGVHEQHGPRWAAGTRDLGGWHRPQFIPRKVRDIGNTLSILALWEMELPPSLGWVSTI